MYKRQVANIERWAAAPAPVDGTVTPPSSFVSAFGGYAGDADSAFAGVEAHGELEVRLRLHSPRRHLAAALASPAFAISSPASWDRTVDVDGSEVTTPAGTGPYRWADAAEAAELTRAHPGASGATILVPSARHRGSDPAAYPVACLLYTSPSPRD